MKRLIQLTVCLLLLSFQTNAQTQKEDPWQENDLEAPAKLALQIKSGEAPLIISVGPAALIKGSVDIGPASKAENLEKLRVLLNKQPKDKSIVIYCGCCPFEPCPNIRPAFTLVKEINLPSPQRRRFVPNVG